MLSRYLLDSNGEAVFQFRDTNINQVVTQNFGVGWAFFITLGIQPESEFKIEARNSGILFFTDVRNYTGPIIFTPIDIVDSMGTPTMAEEVIITLTVKNPLVIVEITNWFTSGFEIINYSGFNKMLGLVRHDSERVINETPAAFTSTTNLQEFTWFADDVFDFDDRFFQGGLDNIEELSIRFPYVDDLQDYNVDNLKTLPNLTRLFYTDEVIPVTGTGFNFQFDPTFNWGIEEYNMELRFAINSLLALPEDIKYLKNLRIFTITMSSFGDYTFPIDGATNNVLEQIIVGANSILNDNFLLPRNFGDLTRFERMGMGFNNRANTAHLDSELTFFYNYFYSVLYNETDNLKPGYVISSVSFAPTDPAGWHHDHFRELDFCGNNSWNKKNSIALQPLVDEMNATGFNFITFYTP